MGGGAEGGKGGDFQTFEHVGASQSIKTFFCGFFLLDIFFSLLIFD